MDGNPCDLVDCEDDGNICTESVCNPASGKCEARRFCRRVFVTSAVYRGSLGGPLGADQKCKGSAKMGGLGGEWSAWVSGPGRPHPSIQTSELPFHRLDGETVATSGAGLLSGSLLAPIVKTEVLSTVPKEELRVWTGLTAEGAPTGTECESWTSDDDMEEGTSGICNNATSSWSKAFSPSSCFQFGHLYCFEL
ncbi:MAG: DUF1554 domain-containing protein [Myxococcales bacterium]|nr:DUF1554 domain-containing protein [Myxococcales bacterium]